MRRGLAGVAVVAVTSLLLLTVPVEANSATTPVTGSLRLSAAVVAPGATVTLTGKLPPSRSRVVKLQTWTSGTWKALTSKRSSPRGAFRFSLHSAAGAGGWRYRVLAPSTRLGGKRYRAVVTPTRTLTVVTLTAADAGWRHACALGSNQRAWCWGDNTYGELGDGATVSAVEKTSSGPVAVIGAGWTSISTGGASTCGLKKDSTAWCWGERASFSEDPSQSSTPHQVPGAWTQISQGQQHTCGVHTDATAWCWGENGDGQLGVAVPTASQMPLQVPGSWLQVVAGVGATSSTTCGIKQDHSAWCWGAGTSGQLGDNHTTTSASPVAVAGGHAWASLTVGDAHTCGLDTAGVGWCWGSNQDGRLGDGTVTERHAPVPVTVAGTWKQLDAGFQHTCGVSPAGAGWCWGWNDHGQLGDGSSTTTYYPEPEPRQLPGTWSSLAAGFYGSVGTRSTGLAWAWGAGDHGELGAGATTPSPNPRQVAGIPRG